MNSIFSLLWKRRDVSEDFRTEILCWVLRSLNRHSCLTEFFNKIGVQATIYNPKISTQETVSCGRFDIVVRDSHTLIVFENKWDSPVDINQLVKYDNYLDSSGKITKYLIHVTKDHKPVGHNFKTAFVKLSWSKLYESLSEYRMSNEIVHEFLNFLEEEGVAMQKVTWEIINGAKSVYSLTRIIVRACEELNLSHKWVNCSSDYTAQCIDDRLYVYFFLKDAKLYFCIYDDKKYPDDLSVTLWSNDHGVFFDFDDNCFFHKTLEEQVDTIKNYISNLLKIIGAQQGAAPDPKGGGASG